MKRERKTFRKTHSKLHEPVTSVSTPNRRSDFPKRLKTGNDSLLKEANFTKHLAGTNFFLWSSVGPTHADALEVKLIEATQTNTGKEIAFDIIGNAVCGFSHSQTPQAVELL